MVRHKIITSPSMELYGKGALRTFVGRTTLTMGVTSAVISFNDDACDILNIMKEYGLEVGKYCSDFCVSHDIKRIKEMDRKSSDRTKK